MRLVCLIAAATLTSTLAHAHVYILPVEAKAGARTDIDLRISHGCSGSPTTAFTVTLPEGVTNVTIEHKSDWTIETTTRPLAKPQQGEGGAMITHTVDTIRWSGNSVPEGRFASFRLRGVVNGTPGSLLFFKSVQTCAVGELTWDGTPAPGQSLEDLMRNHPKPAPFLKLSAPAGGGHQH